MEDIAIVYMVAGMSSRFGKVKQFAKVGPSGETLIEYSLNQALKSGFTKIVFIVGEKTESGFRELFGDSYKNTPVYYAYQGYDKDKRDRPWGTVDAVCCARKLLNCRFVICNGDDIYGERTFKIMVNHIKTKKHCATVGYKVSSVLSGKGDVNRGLFELENHMLKSITEVFNINAENLKEKGLNENSLVSMNMFALNPKVVKKLCMILDKFKKDHQNDRKIECLLPHELSNLIKNDGLEIELYSTSDTWLGLTNPEDEEIVRNKIKK